MIKEEGFNDTIKSEPELEENHLHGYTTAIKDESVEHSGNQSGSFDEIGMAIASSLDRPQRGEKVVKVETTAKFSFGK
jgi:hypothetical protein